MTWSWAHLVLGLAVRPRRQERSDHRHVAFLRGDAEGGPAVLLSDESERWGLKESLIGCPFLG